MKEWNKLPLLCEHDKCTGCMVCRWYCKKNAIEMNPDEKGFLYPIIQKEKCVGCMHCEMICPVLHPQELQGEGQKYYGFKHHDINVRLRSSSGGFFTWLSDIVLKNNGIVYGAVFDEKHRVIHSRAEAKDSRDKMRGSKYVQSNMGDIYESVLTDLKTGRLVLFTGTSCQCDAVLLLANKKKIVEHLLTMDFICEGVASPLVYEKFLAYEEKKHNGMIERITFRDKEEYRYKIKPIFSRRLILEMKNKSGHTKLIYDKYGTSRYLDSMFSGLLQRDCCLDCQFHRYERVADFTCGDFHRYHGPDEFKDEYGISEILVNSSKAKEIIKRYADEQDFLICDREGVWQPLLSGGITVDPIREEFWIRFKEKGFVSATNLIMLKVYKREFKKVLITVYEKAKAYYSRSKAMLI